MFRKPEPGVTNKSTQTLSILVYKDSNTATCPEAQKQNIKSSTSPSESNNQDVLQPSLYCSWTIKACFFSLTGLNVACECDPEGLNVIFFNSAELQSDPSVSSARKKNITSLVVPPLGALTSTVMSLKLGGCLHNYTPTSLRVRRLRGVKTVYRQRNQFRCATSGVKWRNGNATCFAARQKTLWASLKKKNHWFSSFLLG